MTPRLGRPGSSCSQTVAGGAACRLTRSRRPLGRGPRWPAQPCNSPAVWAPCVQTARRASMLRPAVPGDSPRGSGYIARPWAAFEVATPTPVLRTPTVTHLPTGPARRAGPLLAWPGSVDRGRAPGASLSVKQVVRVFRLGPAKFKLDSVTCPSVKAVQIFWGRTRMAPAPARSRRFNG